MSMATTALLRLAPLPPHPRLLTPSSSKPALPAPLGSGRRALRLARAAGDELADQNVYNGVYGPWSVDDTDVREVLLYRAWLVTAAASVLVATSGAFLPEGNAVGDAVRQGADLLYAAGAGRLTPPSARNSLSRISAPARSTPCSRSATTSSSPTSSSRASPTRSAGRSRTWSAPEGSSPEPSPSTASPSIATSPGSCGTRASTPSTPRSRRPSPVSSPRSPRSRLTGSPHSFDAVRHGRNGRFIPCPGAME